jgi:hypothetical protein
MRTNSNSSTNINAFDLCDIDESASESSSSNSKADLRVHPFDS